jgi:hypothetical protein
MAEIWKEVIDQILKNERLWAHRDAMTLDIDMSLRTSLWNEQAKNRLENYETIDRSAEFVVSDPSVKLDSIIDNPPVVWEFVNYWSITFHEVTLVSSSNDLWLVMDFEWNGNVYSTQWQWWDWTILLPWEYTVTVMSQLPWTESRIIYETDSWGQVYNKIFMSSETVLPVEFASDPTAEVSWKSVITRWSTSAESENDMFQIERVNPTTGEFDIIWYVVPDSPDSDTLRSYEYLDQNPLIWSNVYRIIQTDFDGTRTTSEVFGVEFQGWDEMDLSKVTLSPNPLRWDNFILDMDYLSNLWISSSDVSVVHITWSYVAPTVDNEWVKEYDMYWYPKWMYVAIIMYRWLPVTLKFIN